MMRENNGYQKDEQEEQTVLDESFLVGWHGYLSFQGNG
jgi:hypothetical protein